jgi:HlyD family secretion protein
MTWWKLLIAVVLVFGVAAITAQGLKDKPPPAVEVQVGSAKKAPIKRTVTGGGKVEAATTVKISSSLSGDLLELNVKVGDPVTHGQVLGRIDKRRFEAAMQQARASASAAKGDVQGAQVAVDRAAAELGRVTGLVEKGMAAKAEVDQRTADRDSALAQLAAAKDRAAAAAGVLEQAQSDLAKTTLYSPIDGNVIEVTREVGERVRGSDFSEDIVMTLAALATMEVKIEVSEHEVVHLKLGQRSEVKVDALEGQTFEGSVVEIAQKALIRNQGTEAETTSFPVKVAMLTAPPGVLTGMSSEVKIIAESRDGALVVPVQAVTVRPEKMLTDTTSSPEGALKVPVSTEQFAKVVFVIDADNKAHVRRVRTGIASDTDVEVLEGLKEGERIVEGPYRTLAKELKDGDSVEEVKPGEHKGGFGGKPKGAG